MLVPKVEVPNDGNTIHGFGLTPPVGHIRSSSLAPPDWATGYIKLNSQMLRLTFSVWRKFDERSSLEGVKLPGIYALAVSRENISGRQFSLLEEIVYFGMTNAAYGLKGRLNAFNNTMRDKAGPGHGGAQRFNYDHADPERLARKLYVSICPFSCDPSSGKPSDFLVMGKVAQAEYKAFAEYVRTYGSLPKYNDKKKSPKR